MAQLALAAAGAAIGGFFGGPVGAQIGWAAGSLIGGVLFAPDQQGPRLQDTKVQVSSYGAAVPICYGGVRVAGNVIWSTNLQEHAEDASGKGGPSVTNYSYSVSCAVLIAEGEIAGIRRIWADAKLVYDVTEDADTAARAESERFAEFFTFYPGNETQMPDPTIEAVEGAGNVEAYRGCAYVVFDSVPLADYGNRVPNFTFEITTEPAVAVTADVLAPLELGPWENTATGAKPRHSKTKTTYRYPASGTATYDGDDLAAAEAAMLADYAWATQYLGYYTSVNGLLSMFSTGTDASTDINNGNGARYVYLAYNLEVPDNVDVSGGYGPGLTDQEWCDGVSTIAGCSAGSPTESVMSTVFPEGIGSGGASVGHTGIGRMFGPGGPPGDDPHYDAYRLGALDNVLGANCVSCAPVGGYFPIVKIIKHRFIRVERALSLPPQTCEIGDPVELGIAQVPGNSALCIQPDGTLSPNVVYAQVSGAYRQLVELDQDATVVNDYPLGPVLASGSASDTQAYWDAQAVLAGVGGSYGVDYPADVADVALGSDDSTERAAGSALLSAIVTDLCARAGLEAADIDVTELTDVVLGYKVMRQMSARAALESLRQAFWFDAVENGDVLQFVKRGGASVAAIEADDLGASESGEAVALVVPRRAQETELPAEITVAYECRAADYQTSTQQARRVTTGSQQRIGVELPIVLTDQAAADVADVLMVDAWQGRSERKFATTRKWSHLLPTDIVTLDDGDFTYVGRITEKVEDGPVINWTMRDEEAATYSPNATPGVTSGGGSAITFTPPMRLELMDLPALRDDDDDAGFYAAASGFLPGFSGGRLYKSLDDASFAALQDMNVGATIGYATTVLGDFSGGNVIDELNTVTVRLHDGSLSTTTRDELLNGANGALIGDEVIQFLRATLSAPSVYILSGLLRGRRGTEQHMSTHAAEDRFVLLNEATVYRIGQSVPHIGAAYYRGVPYGGALTDAVSQEFENTGAALKPLSPSHLHATNAGGGSYTLTWVRRTRIGGNWRDYVDASLSEDSEQYSVDVERAGSVISTTAVTAQTATVAAIAGDVIRVYQVSALVGRGFPAEITL